MKQSESGEELFCITSNATCIYRIQRSGALYVFEYALVFVSLTKGMRWMQFHYPNGQVMQTPLEDAVFVNCFSDVLTHVSEVNPQGLKYLLEDFL